MEDSESFAQCNIDNLRDNLMEESSDERPQFEGQEDSISFNLQPKKTSNSKQKKNLQNKILIVQVLISDERKNLKKLNKVKSFLKLIEGPAISFVLTSTSIPSNFTLLESNDQSKKQYRQIYNSLSCLKFEMFFTNKKSLHSHVRIQKKGGIFPCVPNDKEVVCQGPFHTSIYDLQVLDLEAKKNMTSIKVQRFETQGPIIQTNSESDEIFDKELTALVEEYVNGRKDYIVFADIMRDEEDALY